MAERGTVVQVTAWSYCIECRWVGPTQSSEDEAKVDLRDHLYGPDSQHPRGSVELE